jgi:glyoxylate/hydroxypyruvate reductase A
MSETIPLVTRLAQKDEQKWLAALREKLPIYNVKSFTELDRAERSAARVAICANPDPAHIAALPNLVWLQSLWSGVERLVAELPASSPAIIRLRDPQLAASMAEAVLAGVLYLHRHMPAYLRQQQNRIWQGIDQPNAGQRKIGILGLGDMGAAAARLLLAPGFAVAGWSRSPKNIEGIKCLHGDDGLGLITASSDILVILLPLTKATRALVDSDFLAHMPPGAGIINFGRGPIIDSAALLAALESGHVSHALLDVFEREPLPAGSPLWSHPGITIWPHIAAVTSIDTASKIAAENINTFLRDGTIPEAVSRSRGY